MATFSDDFPPTQLYRRSFAFRIPTRLGACRTIVLRRPRVPRECFSLHALILIRIFIKLAFWGTIIYFILLVLSIILEIYSSFSMFSID